MKGHHDKKMRVCHYFNNAKICPYMEIGCKFRHEVSEKCFFDEGCTNHLCQYRHKTVGKSIIKDTTNLDKDRYKVDGFIESNDNEILSRKVYTPKV